jgi:ketosteroid isomerase-like protein
MSQANVEVVKRLFETYRRGDYAEAADCLAPDVVYEVGQVLVRLTMLEPSARMTQMSSL